MNEDFQESQPCHAADETISFVGHLALTGARCSL